MTPRVEYVLAIQAAHVANKTKYTREEYRKRYDRAEKLLRKLKFYKDLYLPA